MRINLEHIKTILTACLDAERMFIEVDEIYSKYPIDDNHDFGFHYLLLIEQGFIRPADGDLLSIKGCGYQGLIDGEEPLFYNARVRLTASGHEFAATLESPGVFERMKSFSNEPLSVLMDVGKELAVGYLKQKCGITV